MTKNIYGNQSVQQQGIGARAASPATQETGLGYLLLGRGPVPEADAGHHGQTLRVSPLRPRFPAGTNRCVPLLPSDPAPHVRCPRHLPLAADHHGDGDDLLQH